MSPADIAMLVAAAPAVGDLVVKLVKAIKGGDEQAAREAAEAAIVLAFEARQAAKERL